MSSCLYECDILHARFSPKKYKLSQKIFMFYLDLDELEDLGKKFLFFGRNQWKLFNFCDKDHYVGPHPTAKENILAFLSSKGMSPLPQKIKLLTHLRVLGYVFNPVSFYFCFDGQDRPVAVVAEVGNTFGEQKAFYLGKDKWVGDAFKDRQTKYYYISPFVDLDAQLDFHLEVPGETMNIRVDDWKEGQKFFISTMTGNRKPLSDAALLWYALRYPLVTLQVILSIHWHAWRLWLLKVPHHPKQERPDLQRDVTREYQKK